MTASFFIEESGGVRAASRDEFPLSIGGPDGDLLLKIGETTAGWIDLVDDTLVVRPATTAQPLKYNGVQLRRPESLQHGDVLSVGDAALRVSVRDGAIFLQAERSFAVNETEPPQLVDQPGATQDDGGRVQPRIQPVRYEPPAEDNQLRRRPNPRTVVFGAVLALAASSMWYLFSAKPVLIEIIPVPDTVDVLGALDLDLDDRYLLHPGTYTVTAEKEGYETLNERLVVTGDGDHEFEFSLIKKPGLLRVVTVDGANVIVDGEVIGATPTDAFTVSPGVHQVAVNHPRYLPFDTELVIEGGEVEQELKAELTPGWGTVTLNSDPEGATVHVGGEDLGRTPLVFDLMAGARTVGLRLPGFKPWQKIVDVEPKQQLELDIPQLEVADGELLLRSNPSAATVTVGGVYHGLTPVTIYLKPDETHTINISKTGHQTRTRTVSVASGENTEIDVSLSARSGELRLIVTPAEAEVFVDGVPRGGANQTMELSAVPHNIEVRALGHDPYTTTVTPRPGYPKTLSVTLKTAEQARIDATPTSIRIAVGQELLLMPQGRFEVGTSRRDPGRRANETMHSVDLQRRFYIAKREVTNDEYRKFDRHHSSRSANGKSLNGGDQPVVNVSWNDAARFCNWLSEQDSLPPAYVQRGGQMHLIRPPTTGYRLPTEAEWAWAARFSSEHTRLEFPWGGGKELPERSGNYGDRSAGNATDDSLTNYDDGFVVSAPVASFQPNALGLYDLGGNVAEWVNDNYSLYPAGTRNAVTDPLGPTTGEGRVIRGSGWRSTTLDELRLARREPGTAARDDVGFRIARYLD